MYFKILREDLTHHGYTYHNGLNVDPNPFDSTPNCRGGLFFADEKKILRFCDYGTKIVEVTVPDGEAIVLVEEKYKAHRIILGQIRELWTKETFEWLISCGVDIYADNDLALRFASENGHMEVVKLLLESGADVHAEGDYALRWAAKNGYDEVVKILLELGADVHIRDDFALRWASANGHLEVVKFLLESGANVHARNNFALHWASRNGHMEVVEYLKSLY